MSLTRSGPACEMLEPATKKLPAICRPSESVSVAALRSLLILRSDMTLSSDMLSELKTGIPLLLKPASCAKRVPRLADEAAGTHVQRAPGSVRMLARA